MEEEYAGDDLNDLCACGHGLDQHGDALGGTCAVCECDAFVE
jgi:hypothetical protein